MGEKRQTEIATAALEILADGGPRQLTARRLGARVGLDGSTLFRHFESKAAILHAAIDQFETALVETIPAEAPSWGALRSFFVGRLALVQARPEIVRLAFNQRLLAAAGQEEHAERVRAVVERSFAFVQKSLEHARAEGVVRTDVPVIPQVWMVAGVLRGAAIGSMVAKPNPDEVWAWLATTLCNGESK